MKIIDDIVEQLSAADADLTNALIRGKVLASKLDQTEVAAWINRELNGYSKVDDIPAYRIISMTPFAFISNGYWKQERAQLPVMHLKPQQQEMLQRRRIGASIAVIQEWAKNPTLEHTFPPEVHNLFEDVISADYDIYRMWGAISPGSFTKILTDVRTRYLDFALELSKKFPDEPSDPQAAAKERGIGDLLNNTIIGEHAVFNFAIGAHSSASQSVRQVIERDISSLAAALKVAKVSDSDIRDLKCAIADDGDAHDLEHGNFGPKVRSWFGNMISIAGTAAWNVTSQTAAAVLGAALSNFYGFGK